MGLLSHSHKLEINFPRLLGSPTGFPPLAGFLNPPSSPTTDRVGSQPPHPQAEDALLKRRTCKYTQKYQLASSFSDYGAAPHFQAPFSGWGIHFEGFRPILVTFGLIFGNEGQKWPSRPTAQGTAERGGFHIACFAPTCHHSFGGLGKCHNSDWIVNPFFEMVPEGTSTRFVWETAGG